MGDSRDVQHPALPWEIIEIIDHSSGDSSILCNSVLTCRALRPRSILVLLTHVRVTCRDKLFYLCNVLQDNPELQPLVRSLAIPLRELSPFPLLPMLPNLRQNLTVDDSQLYTSFQGSSTIPMHNSTLICCLCCFLCHSMLAVSITWFTNGRLFNLSRIPIGTMA